MTEHQYDEEVFLGYLEGDLPPEQVERFEAQMRREPRLRNLVAQLLQDRHRLRQLPDETPPLGMMEQVNLQLERRMLLDEDEPQVVGRVGGSGSWRVVRYASYAVLAASVLLVASVFYLTLTDFRLIHRAQPTGTAAQGEAEHRLGERDAAPLVLRDTASTEAETLGTMRPGPTEPPAAEMQKGGTTIASGHVRRDEPAEATDAALGEIEGTAALGLGRNGALASAQPLRWQRGEAGQYAYVGTTRPDAALAQVGAGARHAAEAAWRTMDTAPTMSKTGTAGAAQTSQDDDAVAFRQQQRLRESETPVDEVDTTPAPADRLADAAPEPAAARDAEQAADLLTGRTLARSIADHLSEQSAAGANLELQVVAADERTAKEQVLAWCVSNNVTAVYSRPEQLEDRLDLYSRVEQPAAGDANAGPTPALKSGPAEARQADRAQTQQPSAEAPAQAEAQAQADPDAQLTLMIPSEQIPALVAYLNSRGTGEAKLAAARKQQLLEALSAQVVSRDAQGQAQQLRGVAGVSDDYADGLADAAADDKREARVAQLFTVNNTPWGMILEQQLPMTLAMPITDRDVKIVLPVVIQSSEAQTAPAASESEQD